MSGMIFYNPEHCRPDMMKYIGQPINMATGRPVGMDKKKKSKKPREPKRDISFLDK